MDLLHLLLLHLELLLVDCLLRDALYRRVELRNATVHGHLERLLGRKQEFLLLRRWLGDI